MAKPLDLPLLLIPVMVVILISVSFAQTNVTSGASVQAVAGAGWSSPSGHFVFGFYATDGGLAVGVWLATAPSITVTWTASRNDTPATGGALRLTYDGRLLWTGANGQDRTVAAPPQPAVAAAMRDDGNFVLYAANATVAWSTFAAPTDTLLAGQDLAPGAQLFSSVSATSRATGKYRLTNQLNDGNLVMYPAGTMNVAAAAYWDTGTFQIGFPLTLRLDASGVLYLVSNNGSYTKNLTKASAAQAVEQAHYHRVTLDPDGVLRSYRHGLLSSGGWKTDVEWIGPSDRCHVKGACGFNSYCVLDRDAQPSCLCPPGFDLIDAGDAAGGCTASSGAGECTGGREPTLVRPWRPCRTCRGRTRRAGCWPRARAPPTARRRACQTASASPRCSTPTTARARSSSSHFDTAARAAATRCSSRPVERRARRSAAAAAATTTTTASGERAPSRWSASGS